jgi:hypothetical protein
LSKNTERKPVKASVRKQVQELLETLPKGRTLTRLKEEYVRKGFLSKRELKELSALKPSKSQAA